MTEGQAEKAFIHQIKSNQKHMVALLQQWCQINSGTSNLTGLSQMRKALIKAYQPLADDIQSKTLPSLECTNREGLLVQQHFGKALLIRKRSHLKRRVLLCGHMDTVYNSDNSSSASPHPQAREEKNEEGYLKGPGVADMKGGLVVMLYALNALERHAAALTIGWDVFINSEEEIGSPASGPLLAQMASEYQAALVYEPALSESGTLAKNRSGSGQFTWIATGKAAHVGRAFDLGKNAICYLSEVVLALDALNGQKAGVIINVGSISGGYALNRVPDKAVTQINVRIQSAEDEAWIQAQFAGILESFNQKPGYTLICHGHFGRPVKRILSGTERLFQRIQKQGKRLGMQLDWHDSGGCCDGNNLAQSGLAVLDTLGVRGGHLHSPEEYLVLESLWERAALSALLLIDLAKGGLEELTS